MELPEFDVTQQLPQDLMHVLLEGIFPLHLEQLLQYVVQVSGLLTLNQINSRISAFPYAYFNDKPGPLNGFDPQGTQTGIMCVEDFVLCNTLSFSCSDVGTTEYTPFHFKPKFFVK